MARCSSTQLARVADRAPLLTTLRTGRNATHERRLAVKIRPTLVHYVVEGRVWCVIRSKQAIKGVADYGVGGGSNDSEARHKLLVAVADGNVWVVTLPDKFQPGAGVLTSVVLERSSTSGMVQWFCQLPGVQSVEHQPAGAGLTSLTLMRSVVTPTTLVVSIRSSAASKLQRHQSLELDDLEGEQSTCSFCLNSGDSRHTLLLASLFPEVKQDAGVVAILQGDLDGWVRFSLVQYPIVKGDAAKASVIRSGTLLQLDQPVQMIVPFLSSAQPAPSTEVGDVATSLPMFDALLVLGTRGRVGIVDLKNGCPMGIFPISLRTLEIGCAVQTLICVSSLAMLMYCASGSAFVCRGTDLLAKAQPFELDEKRSVDDTFTACAEKLPLQSGILRLAIHNTDQVSILFASGRITTIDNAALQRMVSEVLPLLDHTGKESAVVSENRVRNLLHRIAEISDKSTALRSQSKQMDHQLKTLHSALEMLRLVDAAGVQAVVKCELRASLIATGAFSDRQTIKLACSLRFVNPDAIVSLDDWWLCLYARTQQQTVTTYSFPLQKVFTCGEQIVILDPDMLALQDQRSLSVSCSLAFCPSQPNKSGDPNINGFKSIKQEEPLSFLIPLLQDRRFLFAQLSQPIEQDIPVSQVAINAAFRQSHDPFMPVSRNGNTSKEDDSCSLALWSGVQYWAALADHAQKNPSFASLWSKIASSDVVPVALSPPSRFVISIPSFFIDESDDEADDEDEDFEKVRIERMVSFLRQVLEVPVDEIARLRRSCRTQHGKLWTVMRTFSGSLILLRFTPSEDLQRSVDLTIQCSDVADLSAMRALVLDAINNWNDGVPLGISDDDHSDDLALDMSEVLEPIVALENILEDLAQKAIRKIEDPKSAICTDEVLHALSQLAHLETQTLTLYWKSRLHLNRTIM